MGIKIDGACIIAKTISFPFYLSNYICVEIMIDVVMLVYFFVISDPFHCALTCMSPSTASMLLYACLRFEQVKCVSFQSHHTVFLSLKFEIAFMHRHPYPQWLSAVEKFEKVSYQVVDLVYGGVFGY